MNRRTMLAGAAGLLLPAAAPLEPEGPYAIAYFHDRSPMPTGRTAVADREIRRRDRVERWGAELDRASLREENRLRAALHDGLQRRDVQVRVMYPPDDGAQQDAWLKQLAAYLITDGVKLFLTGSNSLTAGVHRIAPGLPIVMVSGSDPVGAGFAASLDKPGGSITGICIDPTPEDERARIGLLQALVPGIRRVLLLAGPAVASTPSHRGMREDAARAAGLAVRTLEIAAPERLDDASAAIQREGAEAVVVAPDPLLRSFGARIVQLITALRLPALFPDRDFVESGGLMSHGSNIRDRLRQAGRQVGRIMAGTAPGDVPIEPPAHLELVINLQTARALGLVVPTALLARTDDVVE